MNVQKKNYKHTIQLPKTDFPMKANLPHAEPKQVEAWESSTIGERIRKKSAGREKYTLHDGPPYANGVIHQGHALNKILKDIIVKYKTMRGFDAHYVPGWDCHGMPIEHAIFKEMGKRKEDVDRLEFRKKARKYAEKYVQIQREEFKRLGVFGDWQNPYLTMDFNYQATIAKSFLKLLEDGFIEQRLKPVPWCYDCETALADAELEYEDKTSPAVFVAFKIKGYETGDEANCANSKLREIALNNKSYVIVWTTTPWTLPANVAVAFHPTISYAVFEAENKFYVAAQDLLPNLQKKFDLKEIKPIESFLGKDFEGLILTPPFGRGSLSPVSRAVLADYVSSTDGTGIVHIAPGHGVEDYEVSLRYYPKLSILSPVDEKGRFTSDFEECKGVLVHRANKRIIELLREKEALLFPENYSHSYPHCWRCKNPIIFRATKQWFLKVDHNDLRKRLSNAINQEINFFPDWGKNRIGSMVETRPDWCLSRQRLWGVPIPVIRCRRCEKIFLVETEANIKRLFSEKGADVWFEKEVSEFFDGQKIPNCCSSPDVRKEEDIIDVWFDSGVSHQAVLRDKNFDLKFPADLYLEGSDQHRGWFQSALITGMALEGRSPFKSVLTHGFVVDGEGKKMSKSAGNVVAPQEVMKEYGADILRLWVAACDYSQDIRLSQEILKRLADAYRKIRNTFRFLLGNLHGFDPTYDAVRPEEFDPVDQYLLMKSNHCFREIEASYESFNFLTCFQEAYEFCNVTLSSFYLDVVKDRLYTSAPKGAARRSAQTAMWHVLRELVRVLAPILPFTAEEVWRFLPEKDKPESVHEAEWPDLKPKVVDCSKDWELIRSLHKVVLMKLEESRIKGNIAASLDAKLQIGIKEQVAYDTLRQYEAKLRFYYLVSQLVLKFQPDQPDFFQVDAEHADGIKCVRCWNYSTQVGCSQKDPELCERCVEALRGFEGSEGMLA